MVSDLVFQWHLASIDGGTKISVHVDIPEREASRLASAARHHRIIAASARRTRRRVLNRLKQPCSAAGPARSDRPRKR
jgi:hypothetical protein